ncbi:MAG TPA: RNA polymerase sigma factor [Bacillota bacterium]|nr:RNA polymerase sigma factor [Bacillota bacterium]HPF42379.1 RNA polymerase sigma factor [Bacillota bacterium]HPJ85408.1 RNA polymerase sigma factor [Bacillota bacterium]HPQ61296.1 RNA polymerase sigma factor [Bacillota bacterium]HRX91928.1 RNA polymerase sigma factor [Candidatus Izemoplasmatales bacterium]
MPDDLDQLVRKYNAGDTEAFDQLYELTYRQVYFAVLPILNDRSLAEDIVQDTYMKLCACLSGYRERNLLAYVITIARNLAKNEYNRRKREIRIESVEADYSQVSLADHLEIKAEKEELVKEILDSLDLDEKNVFLLHNLENLPHREIAVILDKPIGTVTWIHAKALKKLKAKFKER